jgi:sirohydrochlorin ferrochelatase
VRTISADPVLIGCGHGSRLPAGRRAIAELRLAIGRARPGLEVRAANVDVHKPALDDVVAELAVAGRRMVVVPLLLSTGYHVRVDIARAVSSAGGLAVAADALGPDPALIDVLAQRLLEAGFVPGDPVVLAAAGSRDPRAGADVDQVAAGLAARLGAPVTVGYLASATPTVADAVVAARRVHPGRPLSIASYLLAPGHFSGRLTEAGADLVTAPLTDSLTEPSALAGPGRGLELLAGLALRRYDRAARLRPDGGGIELPIHRP